MYPSNSSSFFNGNDLISYPNQPFCSRTLSTESNPSSKNQETNCALPPPPAPSSLSFFPFPYSPFDDNEIFLQQHHDGDLLDLQHHHHHQSLAPPPHEAAAGVVNMEVSITTTTKVIPPNKSTTPSTTSHHDQQQIPMRRRSSKRDRHSKINTAKGLRDRRMRLALDVAKRFFGLQDMLGFDKASKTVEWLLNQAKVEIKQLAREKNIHPSCSSVGAKSASSTSECEGVSSLDEVAVSGNQGQEGDEKAVPIPTTTIVKRRTNNRLSRKSAFNPISKESRGKARERARERTWEKEKLRTRRLGVVDEESKANKQCNNNEAIIAIHSLSRLGPWNPFETVEESQIRVNPSLDVLACEAEERSSQAKDQHLGCVDQDLAHDDSFVIMSRWSPAMILNSLNNPGILQEHQFAEFQSMGKPWEAYNNHI